MTNVHGLAMPQLRAVLTGRVIAPGDADYDETRRVFYGKFDRRPAAIIQPANATDVSRVVSFARETGVELAVHSGGHSLAGHSTTDDGIVLDLRDMKALDLNVHSRTAWAQTGLTAGEYTAAAGAYGLATGFGDTGSVGIGGLTLGVDDLEASLVEERGAVVATRSAGHAACADGRDLQCEVAAFVAALPCQQRAALMLRLNHKLGYAEIAATLRCSEREARATVHEVLRSLRDHVGDRL